MTEKMKIREASPNAQLGGSEKSRGVFDVLIVNEGWGSSGYYSKEVLAGSGPKAFPVNTKSFLNHGTDEQPERRVQDLVGVFTSEAAWNDSGSKGPGLYAELTVRPSLVDFVEEVKSMIGMSISAMADSDWGEGPDGREGPIIEALLPYPLNSVDLVTVAGRGGMISGTTESAAAKSADAAYLQEHFVAVPSPATTRAEVSAAAEIPEGTEMAFTPEQEAALIALAAAAPGLIAEAEASRKARDAAEKAAAEAAKIDPLEAAAALTEALVASGLTAESQQDVIADVRVGVDPVKAIERWKAVEARTKSAEPQFVGGQIISTDTGSAPAGKPLSETFDALFQSYGGSKLIEKASA